MTFTCIVLLAKRKRHFKRQILTYRKGVSLQRYHPIEQLAHRLSFDAPGHGTPKSLLVPYYHSISKSLILFTTAFKRIAGNVSVQ